MSKTLKDSKPEVDSRKGGKRPRRVEGHPEKGGQKSLRQLWDELEPNEHEMDESDNDGPF